VLRTGARTGIHTILETSNTVLFINIEISLSINTDISKVYQ
jgi:hypothetical protein